MFLFYNSVAKLYFNGIINLKLGVLKKGCDKVKTTSDWQCPYCKAQINPGDQICIHCGEKIYDTNVTIADLHHHEEEKKINKVPTIIYFKDGKVVDMITREDDSLITSSDLEKLLDRNHIKK